MFQKNRYKRQAPGAPIAAATINRPIDGLEALERMSSGAGIKFRKVADIPFVSAIKTLDLRLAQSGAGGIPAQSAGTCGTGTITLCDFNPATAVITTTALTDTGVNMSTQAVVANKFLIVAWFMGRWFVIVESC